MASWVVPSVAVGCLTTGGGEALAWDEPEHELLVLDDAASATLRRLAERLAAMGLSLGEVDAAVQRLVDTATDSTYLTTEEPALAPAARRSWASNPEAVAAALTPAPEATEPEAAAPGARRAIDFEFGRSV
jgi:hypothetical protein